MGKRRLLTELTRNDFERLKKVCREIENGDFKYVPFLSVDLEQELFLVCVVKNEEVIVDKLYGYTVDEIINVVRATKGRVW